MIAARVLVLAWWFLAHGSFYGSAGRGTFSPTVVGPFRTEADCEKYREYLNGLRSGLDRQPVHGLRCWSDGKP